MASSTEQWLCDDVFWHTAKHFLLDPLDVLNLSKTCRRMHQVLATKILITDIYFTKEREIWNRDRIAGFGFDVEDDTHTWGIEDPTELEENRLAARDALPAPQPLLHWAIETAAADTGREATALKCIDLAVRHWPDHLQAKDHNWATPIQLAVSRGCLRIVQKLVESGSVLGSFLFVGDLDMVEWVRSKLPERFPKCYGEGWQGYYLNPVDCTALTSAIFTGQIEVAVWLVQDSTAPFNQEWDNAPELYTAAHMGAAAVVSALLE
ncbi:Uu.00g005950.m01.CDS01 [Anthostomella pinea]|uniref:Uu.00g005950.m01.CDS01 n=1 Tax=Anthostomella pinea TaxID=933095 RepID=A0AAI8YIY2_9PEZI|nr:Uu.00g005950.m01.CDS01 [Anthostomella pinea]